MAAENFFPSFEKIALADVTGNGDDEVYLLRPGIADGQPIVALTSRNPGGDPISVIEFNELAGQTRFGSIQAGDVDADRRDEVIVMASNEYIIYTEPASSRAYQSYLGTYSTSLSFAVGNLDGGGIQQGPQLSVTPTTVSLTLQTGQTATRAVQIANSGTGTLTWTSSVTQGVKLAEYSAHWWHGAERCDTADERHESRRRLLHRHGADQRPIGHFQQPAERDGQPDGDRAAVAAAVSHTYGDLTERGKRTKHNPSGSDNQYRRRNPQLDRVAGSRGSVA